MTRPQLQLAAERVQQARAELAQAMIALQLELEIAEQGELPVTRGERIASAARLLIEDVQQREQLERDQRAADRRARGEPE